MMNKILWWTTAAALVLVAPSPTDAATAVFSWVADLTPNLPGIAPGLDRPKAILAGDIDYPPYCFLGDASTGFAMDGFGPSMARGLSEVCDIDVFMGQTRWQDCWDNNQISPGLRDGWFHGCVTYTHTAGARERYLEFTKAILKDNTPAGIISRLDPTTGEPVIHGRSNLTGVRVVDVVGWAPTPDTLALVTNNCTGERMSGYQIVAPTQDGPPNDAALKTLLAGDADAMWLYAEQAESYQCANLPDQNAQDVGYDCQLWDRLGTDFAYIQTGIQETTIAGTTLAISKLGSGLKEILDPCIEQFLETESYYKLCDKYNLLELCFPNVYFPGYNMSTTNTNSNTSLAVNKQPDIAIWSKPTGQLDTTCSDGYCSCPPAETDPNRKYNRKYLRN